MKHFFAFSLCTVVAIIILYSLCRVVVTRQAKRDIDAFLVEFRTSNKIPTDTLKHLSQDPVEAEAIVGRRDAAIRNFGHTDWLPELNLPLNEATIYTSWHLNIIFHKQAGRWFVEKFDEYSPDAKD